MTETNQLIKLSCGSLPVEVQELRDDIRISIQRPDGKEVNLTIQEFEGNLTLYLWKDRCSDVSDVVLLDPYFRAEDEDENGI